MAKGKKNKVGGKARGSTPRHRNPSGGYTPKSKGGGGASMALEDQSRLN